MSVNKRRAYLVVTGLGFLTGVILLERAWGQPVPVAAPGLPTPPGTAAEEPKDANDFSHAMTLPTDNKLQKKMEAAQDIINENIKNPKAETWGEAARLLQSLLDGKEDVFVQVKRKDKAGKEAVHWISVRAEANRLLGTMPAQGKEFYELRYGATARARLDESKATSNPEILADVARRYLHTKAGAEATNLLGTYHLDRGQFVTAALCFERLLNLEGPEKLTTSTLLKATLAFHRTGDKTNAERTWKQLSERSAREGLRLADQAVTLPDLQGAAKVQPAAERVVQPLGLAHVPWDGQPHGAGHWRPAVHGREVARLAHSRERDATARRCGPSDARAQPSAGRSGFLPDRRGRQAGLPKLFRC